MLIANLNQDQYKAFNTLVDFMFDPKALVFVLEGGAGTGKSFLLQTLKDNFNALFDTRRILTDTSSEIPSLYLTATTHKALLVLHGTQGKEGDSNLKTIYSLFGYGVVPKEGLVKNGFTKLLSGSIVVVDEASFLEEKILKSILDEAQDLRIKLIFVGDPYQLSGKPHRTIKAPAFNLYTQYAYTLRTPVRQDRSTVEGDNLYKLSEGFKEALITRSMDQVQQLMREGLKADPRGFKTMPGICWVPSFKGSSTEPGYVLREAGFARLLEELTQKDSNSVILTYTNERTNYYSNLLVPDFKEGSVDKPWFKPGDLVTLHNAFDIARIADDNFLVKSLSRLQTSFDGMSEVLLVKLLSTSANQVTQAYWHPDYNLQVWKQNRAKGIKGPTHKGSFAVLTPCFTLTTHKSQGRTFDRVLIDLQDFRRCTSINQLRKLLYVAASRASKEVIFYGDLV